MKVQMCLLIHHLKYNYKSEWNYVINMLSQLINSFILKNLYQAKKGTHMNKKKLNINLIQHLWFDLHQERIDQVLLLSIDIYGSNLIIRRRFLKNKSTKIWSDVWDKIVVEEGLTMTWPWWIMHRRRASGSLGIEEPYVMKKGRWMFNPRNQTIYEELYITKYQSLLNQDMKWLGDQK
jgi:hypothetical protein